MDLDEKVLRVIRESGKLGTTLWKVRETLGAAKPLDLALQRLRKNKKVSFDKASRRWRTA
jgi:hypothetical protein